MEPLRGPYGADTFAHFDTKIGVCTENSVLIDYVTKSPNVTGDDRSVMLLPDPCVYQKPDPNWMVRIVFASYSK
jgi:hypothetical protein